MYKHDKGFDILFKEVTTLVPLFWKPKASYMLYIYVMLGLGKTCFYVFIWTQLVTIRLNLSMTLTFCMKITFQN